MSRRSIRIRIKKALQNKRRKKTLESNRFWGNVNWDRFISKLALWHPMSIPSYSEFAKCLTVRPMTEEEIRTLTVK